MGSESLIVDTATRIFRDFCDPQTVNRAADDAWKAPAWAALEEAGLTLAALAVPSTAGAAGQRSGDGQPSGLHAAGASYDALPRSVGPVPAVARAGSDDPDPEFFGVDGKVGIHASTTSDDMLVGLSLYPDGRIVASGYREEAYGELSTVTRRNPDARPTARSVTAPESCRSRASTVRR